jgi:galactokinase
MNYFICPLLVNPAVICDPPRPSPLDEHSDYNDGFVLPSALPFKTVVVGSLSSEVEFKVVSCSMGKEVVSFTIDDSYVVSNL